jgi:hypothetical protein
MAGILSRPQLPRCGRRYRRRQCPGGAHQTPGQAHQPSRRAGGAGGLRRPVRAAPGPLQAAGAGLRHRRGGHQAAPGHRPATPRYGGHRSGGHVRQRHRGGRRRAPVLPGLLRHRQAGPGGGQQRDRRHRRGCELAGCALAGRRDGGDARHVPGGGLRPGRLLRRGGGEVPADPAGAGAARAMCCWGSPPPAPTPTAIR